MNFTQYLREKNPNATPDEIRLMIRGANLKQFYINKLKKEQNGT